MNWQIPFNETEKQAEKRMLAAYRHFLDFIENTLPVLFLVEHAVKVAP